MGRWVRFTLAAASLLAIGTTVQLASAHGYRANRANTPLTTPFAPAAVPSDAIHPGSRGGTVAADAHGLLVAERNAGVLIRADRDGNTITKLELHQGLGQLVTDGSGTVYIADRNDGRVIVVDASTPGALTAQRELKIPEPHGLALSPDSKTLYVTSVADHLLAAVDTESLKIKWSTELRAEPRGVAISADGSEATVGFLSSGALAVVDLEGDKHRIRWRSLDPRDHLEIEKEEDGWSEEMIDVAVVKERRSRFQVPTDQGRREARNVYNVAYVGNGLLVAPHQLSTPQMKRVPSRDMQDSYGGGPQAIPAIQHRLAIMADGGTEVPKLDFDVFGAHQPRAMAYDAKKDILYVAGYGDDEIHAFADISQPSAYRFWSAGPNNSRGTSACGPDGLVVDGDDVWMHCELSRKLIRFTPDGLDLDDKEWKPEKAGVHVGPELAASLRSPEIEAGAEIFRRGEDSDISDLGVMACASCHPEGRQDGLSWRLGKSILQTPMLAGRVQGTAPFKWSGADQNLHASFKHTIERLGGFGLGSRDLDNLAAYVGSLEAPPRKTVKDAKAIARGQKLFYGDLDCVACHNGDKLTNGVGYPLASRGLEETDTPSLLGLAHTAPYYHDGSAPDLYTLVTDKGNVHDMADFSKLKPNEAQDLIAYLESL